MSFEINGNSITLTRGDSFYAVVGMSRADGSPYTPEQGDEITFALKRNLELDGNFLDRKPLIQKVIPNNSLLLALTPEDTKDLPFGNYVYDISITFANGDVDTFIKDSLFTVTRKV